MKNRCVIKHHLICILCAVFLSCQGTSTTKVQMSPVQPVASDTIKTKPPSSYNDTLLIHESGVVFFLPDSGQMLRIKSVTKDWIFDGTMHECYYQIRNSKIVMHADWKDLKIYEAYKHRFLLFKKSNSENQIIDLNKVNDPCGAYAFNMIKDPLYLDMTNIEQGLYYYFKK